MRRDEITTRTCETCTLHVVVRDCDLCRDIRSGRRDLSALTICPECGTTDTIMRGKKCPAKECWGTMREPGDAP